MKKSETIYLQFSLDVECPYCKKYTDIANYDDDHIFANAIFSNDWDSLRDQEFECPNCFKTFLINEVKY